jgi:hypothetical protein
MRNLILHCAVLVALSFLPCGCGEKGDPAGTDPEPETENKSASRPTAASPRIVWTEVKLHEVIRAKNDGYSGNGQFGIDPQGNVMAIVLDNCNVSDISPFTGMALQGVKLFACPVEDLSPLKGMPLVELYLEETPVKDISFLSGNTTLQKLYLSSTGVTDLSPLKGLPIVELNLLETHTKDLSPLAGMPIQMLWLTGSPVEDITPLRTCPLVSLTLHKTKVRDLSPLSGTRLQRLHIGETPVTDLTPLAGMNLTRLVFNKEKITKGIEAIQSMRSLRELGSRFDDEERNLVHPAVFWSETPAP